MKNIKKYKKFTSYKTVFAIFLVTSVIAWISGFWLYKTSSEFSRISNGIAELFSLIPSRALSAIIFEAMFLLTVFVSGPTIYAPVSSFFTMAIYGALAGSRVASLLGSSLYPILIEAIFSWVAAYLLVIYSSFITLTGVKIFTDVKKDDERELFDGVLFRAERFRGIFNFRYIASYIMFFIVFLAGMSISSAIKVFLLSF